MQVADEHSSRSRWAHVLPLALIDLTARLAVPASLWALARGFGDAAVVCAALVNVLAIVRGVVGGRIAESLLRRLWRDLVAAARKHDVAALRTRGKDQSVVALLDSLAHVKQYEGATVPRLLANALGLLLVLAAVVALLGGWWLLWGVLAIGVAAPVVVVGQRYLRSGQALSFERHTAAALDLRILIDAATELRVHGVEGQHASRLLGHVAAMATAERKVFTASALMGLWPIGIALLVAVVPIRGRLGDGAADLAEVGIVGATGLAMALGLWRALENAARSRPFLDVVHNFVAAGGAEQTSGAATVDLRDCSVSIRAASHRYEGSTVETPAAVDLMWEPGDGLALTGKNGSGKTTLALCMLGVLPISAGRIAWGEHEVGALDWSSLRSDIVYLPQRGFIEASESVLWHLQLFAAAPITGAEALDALGRSGLLTALEARPGDPLQVRVGELSGGERRRMHLARTLIGEPKVVVLDEPEAGLDPSAREWLRGFLEALSERSRVLVIAHDRSIVPESFSFCACRRSSLMTATATD